MKSNVGISIIYNNVSSSMAMANIMKAVIPNEMKI